MIVSVNVVKTYPVQWTKYKVMRDFAQNFYDAVGYAKWAEAFHYDYDSKKQKLRMFVDNIRFSYEWLLHIGGSTKTSNPQNYAGYFGEGFKIAALCALRDYHYSVLMESSDWKLSAFFAASKIDSQDVEMLAYDIKKRPEDTCCSLTLGGCLPQDYDIFLLALKSFFYPENEIFGKKIWESSQCAIFHRSKNAIDTRLPSVHEFGFKGAVFCGFQMLGTNPFPLVICTHKFPRDDRERKALYRFNVIDVFADVVRHIDGQAAMSVLEKMRRFWCSYEKTSHDIYSWEHVISDLVYKIAETKDVKSAFIKKYPNIVCLERIHGIEAHNRRHQARAWYKSSHKDYIFANQSFLALGYPTLEAMCEEDGGFVKERDANQQEQACFAILERTTEAIYGDFFVLQEKPTWKIIHNPSAIFHGMATCFRQKNPINNARGMRVRRTIRAIYIQKSALVKDNFYDALTTYIHELCHMFGSDGSQAFSYALTEAMTLLLEHREIVDANRTAWIDVFSTT